MPITSPVARDFGEVEQARALATRAFLAALGLALREPKQARAILEETIDRFSWTGQHAAKLITTSESDQARHISTTAGRLDSRGRWIPTDQPYDL